MIVSARFDSLVTFDCVYGDWTVTNGIARLFVEKGLAFKRAKLISDGGGVQIVECDGEEYPKVESAFPVHYIYDPSRNTEYVEWRLVDGFLNARSAGGEWVKYESKSESAHAMHEYVGGCWLVFSGVSSSRRVIYEYSPDGESSSGNEFIQEFICRPEIGSSKNEYSLEGLVSVSPGPGWLSLKVFADSFYIEISDA
ncbi:hypothetical protein [Pseudomonas fluorescens]|uniref:hypothetical protein n=1 Tax=Pseudomonas fluorescens TaxID=294 RepID=UPI0009B81A0A|nr:hypothetical protein [Pseudomonas fluorescens]